MIQESAIKFYLAIDKEYRYPIIMTGLRHADVFKQMHDLGIEYDRKSAVQGFWSSKNQFLNRYEAVEEAKRAGQISKDFQGVILYSEDVFKWD